MHQANTRAGVRRRCALSFALALAITLCAPWAAAQQPTPTIQERIQQLEQQQKKLLQMINELQQQIDELKKKAEVPEEQTLPSIEDLLQPAEPQEVVTGGAGEASTSQSLNPDVWAGGEFVARVGQLSPALYDADGRDRRPILGNRSVEVGFRYSVSTTADAILLLGDHGHGPHVEEAYIDINRERERWKFMLGRWRARWGQINEYHEHDLPFVSYPRSLTNFFGFAGLQAQGLRVQYLLPTRRYTALEVSVLNGLGSETATALLPLGARPHKPSYMVRLRRAWDIDEDEDVDLRLCYLNGPNDLTSPTRTQMLNVSGSWRRIREGARKGDRVLVEYTVYDRDTGLGHVRRDGGYIAYVRKLSERSEWGVMYDRAGFGDPALRGQSQSYNLFVTYKQNENQRYRVQYRHAQYPGGLKDDSLFFQIGWVIGPHFHSFK